MLGPCSRCPPQAKGMPGPISRVRPSVQFRQSSRSGSEVAIPVGGRSRGYNVRAFRASDSRGVVGPCSRCPPQAKGMPGPISRVRPFSSDSPVGRGVKWPFHSIPFQWGPVSLALAVNNVRAFRASDWRPSDRPAGNGRGSVRGSGRDGKTEGRGGKGVEGGDEGKGRICGFVLVQRLRRIKGRKEKGETGRTYGGGVNGDLSRTGRSVACVGETWVADNDTADRRLGSGLWALGSGQFCVLDQVTGGGRDAAVIRLNR